MSNLGPQLQNQVTYTLKFEKQGNETPRRFGRAVSLMWRPVCHWY